MFLNEFHTDRLERIEQIAVAIQSLIDNNVQPSDLSPLGRLLVDELQGLLLSLRLECLEKVT